MQSQSFISPNSPDGVTNMLLAARARAEAKVAAFFESSTVSYFLFRLFLLALVSSYLWMIHFQNLPYISLVFRKPERLLLLCPQLFVITVFFCLITKDRLDQSRYLFILFAICGIFSTFFSRGFSLDAPYLLLTFCGFCYLFGCFFILKQVSRKLRTLVAAALGIALFNLAIYFSLGWSQFYQAGSVEPERWIFFIYLLALELNLDAKAVSFWNYSKNILFPTQWLYPAPFLTTQWNQKRTSLQVQISGYADLLIAALFVYLCSKLRSFSFFSSTDNLSLDWILKIGAGWYLITYLYSVASISVTSGLARICGFDLPAPCLLPLLAASPQDRWRRWNVYFMQFYQWAFFFPFRKRFRSDFLAVMLTFFLTYCLHSVMGNPFNFFGSTSQVFFNKEIFYFLLHGLAVYAGLKIKSRIFNGRTSWGWIGVVVTWTSMILIQALSSYG